MIKNRFEVLPLSQKIQLYLLIPLVYGLVFILYNNFYANEIEGTNPKKIQKVSYDIKHLKPMEVISFFEDKIQSYSLKTKSLKTKEKFLVLEITGTFENLTAFLQKMQTHFQIISFKFIQEEKLKKFNLIVDTQWFFNTKLITKEFIVNQKKGIKIDAIIDQEVLIDGVWFTKGEICNGLKIVSIQKDSVKFIELQTKKEVIVELLDEPL